ncbi:unnamed protein product, partial [Didymodactylos carnosus]
MNFLSDDDLFREICSKLFEFHKIGWTYNEKSQLLDTICEWNKLSITTNMNNNRRIKLENLLEILSNEIILSLLSAGKILSVIQTQTTNEWNNTLLTDVSRNIQTDWLTPLTSEFTSNTWNNLINTTTNSTTTTAEADYRQTVYERQQSESLQLALQPLNSVTHFYHHHEKDEQKEPLHEYRTILNENLSELAYLKWPTKDITSLKTVFYNLYNYNSIDALKTSILVVETIVTNRLADSNNIQRIIKYITSNSNNSCSWMKELNKIIKETGTGKSLQTLLQELEQLNGNIIVNQNELESIYQTIMNYYKESISSWSVNDIKNWTRTSAVSQKKQHKQPFSTNDDCIKMAVIIKAAYIHKQYCPRDIQILSVILLLRHKTHGGRITNIKTGEGKSIIVCMLAVYLALGRKKVDIITTSEVLAIRDTEEFKDFYEMFNLTCTHNCGDNLEDKTNYLLDIVYGTVNHFAGDLLRTEFYLENVRQNRPYEAAIVDEVDSMFIDQSNHYTQLASLTPGMKSLAIIFRLIWSCFSQFNITDDDCFVMINEQKQHCMINILTFIQEKLKNPNIIRCPTYRQEYINSKVPKWIKSCKTAMYYLHEKVDYVISDDGKIVVVDYRNTGVSQTNMHWNDGLHQFLQLKHQLRLSPERMCDSFFSNVTFFKKYRPNLYGLTGTVGAQSSQNFVRDVYEVDVVLIPKYLDSQFTIHPGQLARNRIEWLDKISIECNQFAVVNRRAVLIICQTIQDAVDVASKLEGNHPRHRIKLYVRSDDKQHDKPEQVCEGDIIVATNLAGRGTDLKPVTAINDCGGLHVIVPFLPQNLRVEQQAFGRAGRQGNPGSARLILNQEEDLPQLVQYFKNLAIDEHRTIEGVKQLRDKYKATTIQEATKKVRKIEAKDHLLQQFLNMAHSQREYIDFGNNKKYNPGFDSLRETWGNYCFKTDDMDDEASIQRLYKEFANKVQTCLNRCVQMKRNPDQQSQFTTYVRFQFGVKDDDAKRKENQANVDCHILNELIEHPKYFMDAGLNEVCGESGKIAGANSRSLKLLELAERRDDSDFIVFYNKAGCLVGQGKGSDALTAMNRSLNLLVYEIENRNKLIILNAKPPSDGKPPRVFAEVIFLQIVKSYIEATRNQLNQYDSDKHELTCNYEYWTEEFIQEQLNGTEFAYLIPDLEEERKEWCYEGLQFRYKFIIEAKRCWWKTIFIFVMGVAQVIGGAI